MASTGIYRPRILRILRKPVILLLSVFFLSGYSSDAQYFGRNKPGYRAFNFDVLQTPHFEIYHYLKNDSLLNALSRWSENWYRIHQRIFRDTFNLKNPVIFYNSHADFQQTNTVTGMISTGTGGVTEGLKNRVIMPVAGSLAQTDHTLGHELVHAFQYHLFLKSDSSKRLSINNVPLWMIEGMAEYLSIGSIDPHTSMWMRDALLNNDFPTIKKLSTDSKYFPYRYGQAFWAMVGKTWGDTIIIPLLEKTAEYGFNRAVDSLLGVNEKTLSGMWKSAMDVHFSQYLKRKADNLPGRKIVSEENGGKMNLSPSISPDGKYVAFFSEKNLFTLDLFLAETGTGKIIKKLSSVVKNDAIDDFSFIESSGTWSPDGKKFAFVVFSKGMNKLAILDVRKARITREFSIPGLPSFSNPAWSPDGNKIVITGMVNGINDLYLYYLDNDEVEKVTSDFASNLHPSWSSDGRYIIFAQERLNENPNHKKFSFILAILDLKKKTVRELNVFKDALNLNPYFTQGNKSIYFTSDPEGIRNLYRYDLQTERVYKLTDFMTGLSGITMYSPAISVANGSDLIVYNYYFNNGYQILAASDNQFQAAEADPVYLNYDAGTLPPLKHIASNLVDTTLYIMKDRPDLPDDSVRLVPYKPKFRLDYISNNASIGISTGFYRNNLGGSINMIFSDMVGNNQLFSSLSLNGEIYDFGGQIAYLNQKGKFKWGAALSHIPYRTGSLFLMSDSITYHDERILVDNVALDYLRMFEDNISFFSLYPLSQTKRFETTLSSSWYYYRIDRFNNYYLPGGIYIGGSKEEIPAPGGNNYQQISFAYVEDNSFFGMTSPMEGHRARYQVDKYFGAADVYTTLIDYRQYFYIKPLSLAFRLYHYGMYGKDVRNSAIPPIYIGYPWLIRGYEGRNSDYNFANYGNAFDVSLLSGTKVVVGNAELRFPFTGPERLALIKSKYFLSDVNLFLDSGLAWRNGDTINLDLNPGTANDANVRHPVFSTGASVRINLLGYLVIEPFYAFPLQNGGFRNGVFGLNFVPGW